MKKKCFKCSKIKILTSFYRHPGMPDGHVNKCKDCNKKDVKENYNKKIEYYKIYEKNRRAKPERKAKMAIYQKNRYIRKPGKTRANKAIGQALRSGKLIRLPCSICRTTLKVEAHHPDYRSPLKVIWLCFSHHRELHKKSKNK